MERREFLGGLACAPATAPLISGSKKLMGPTEACAILVDALEGMIPEGNVGYELRITSILGQKHIEVSSIGQRPMFLDIATMTWK